MDCMLKRTEMTSTTLSPVPAKVSVTYRGDVDILGCCHVCQKGSGHSIINTGEDDLVMLTVVVAR